MATSFKIIVVLIAVVCTAIVSTAPGVQDRSSEAESQKRLDETLEVNNTKMEQSYLDTTVVTDQEGPAGLFSEALDKAMETNRRERYYGNAISKWPFGRG